MVVDSCWGRFTGVANSSRGGGGRLFRGATQPGRSCPKKFRKNVAPPRYTLAPSKLHLPPPQTTLRELFLAATSASRHTPS